MEDRNQDVDTNKKTSSARKEILFRPEPRTMSDVTCIDPQGGRYYLHRVILAARSKYWKRFFDENKDAEVEVPFDQEIILKVFQHIYAPMENVVMNWDGVELLSIWKVLVQYEVVVDDTFYLWITKNMKRSVMDEVMAHFEFALTTQCEPIMNYCIQRFLPSMKKTDWDKLSPYAHSYIGWKRHASCAESIFNTFPCKVSHPAL